MVLLHSNSEILVCGMQVEVGVAERRVVRYDFFGIAPRSIGSADSGKNRQSVLFMYAAICLDLS